MIQSTTTTPVYSPEEWRVLQSCPDCGSSGEWATHAVTAVVLVDHAGCPALGARRNGECSPKQTSDALDATTTTINPPTLGDIYQ
jgi:hypothetical protein